MIIEEIIELPTVDLIHGDGDCEVPLMILEISDTSVK
jgi:hypothetical protein